MMLCPKCMVEMLPSKAIKPYDGCCCFGGHGPLSPEEVYLIDCFKCPKCGYSDSTGEQMDNGKQVISGKFNA